MKIGIFSDTHDAMNNIKEIVADFVDEDVEAIIHCGDFCSPFIHKSLELIKETQIKCFAVFGNNDGELAGLLKMVGPYLNITGHLNTCILENKKIAITHGHNVPLLNQLIDCGVYDLVVSGHTHQQVNKLNGKTLVVNPGEACGYLFGTSSYAIIDLSAEELTPESVTFKKL